MILNSVVVVASAFNFQLMKTNLVNVVVYISIWLSYDLPPWHRPLHSGLESRQRGAVQGMRLRRDAGLDRGDVHAPQDGEPQPPRGHRLRGESGAGVSGDAQPALIGRQLLTLHIIIYSS